MGAPVPGPEGAGMRCEEGECRCAAALWRVFWFGVALGLLLAVILHARAEIRVIRALLFD